MDKATVNEWWVVIYFEHDRRLDRVVFLGDKHPAVDNFQDRKSFGSLDEAIHGFINARKDFASPITQVQFISRDFLDVNITKAV
jgi:hypothetical protein